MSALVRRSSPLLIIFLCVLIDMLGYSMIVPLLPFIVHEQAESALVVGMLSSLYALMQLLAAPVLGTLSDRIGRRPVLLGSLLASSCAYALLGLGGMCGSLLLIGLAVAWGGVAGASIPTVQAYISDRAKSSERTRSLGLVGAAFGIGLMVGPAAGGLLSVYGLNVPAFAAALLALGNALFALVALPESLPAERRVRRSLSPTSIASQIGYAVALPNLRPLLLAIFLLNLAFAGLQSNFPIFSSTRFGWDPLDNGIFFAFVGFCGVFTQGVLVGRLLPRFGEPLLIVGGLALMTISLSLTALAPQDWMLFPLLGVMALGLSLAMPSLTSLIAGGAGEGRQGAALGGMQALLSLALIFGPFIAGMLFDLYGPSTPYLGASLFTAGSLTAAIFGLWAALRHGRPKCSVHLDQQP
ncbi:MAG: MFS transporter [Candidatus Viridilinea halotolerans]|uniref:MFS transporter n=1 Tax=Candidatus Viridilinea halotolerans TaxID=2491704 RepID=A0A426U4E4_9CHLR|nr:MAG: MFS transporter [Candidatus Viridilinea halotolerans]